MTALLKIKKMAIALVGFGVAVNNGKFLAAGAVLGLIACVLDQNRFSNFKDKYFKYTLAFIFLYVFTVIGVSLLQNNMQEVPLILRHFEKVTSFLIILVVIGDCQNAWIYGFLGFSVGMLCGEISVVQSFVQGKGFNNGNRYGGIYGNPNSLGSMLEIAIPIFIYSIYKFRGKYIYLGLNILALAGGLACLYLSGSRGATIAVVLEMVAFSSVLAYRKYGIQLWRKYCLPVAVLVIPTIVYFVVKFPKKYDVERVLLWKSAWRMFLDHPLVGIGFNNWRKVYPVAYISPLAKEPHLGHPHNLYLYLLSEIGIVGFVSFMAAIIWQMRVAIKFTVLEYKLYGCRITLSDVFLVVSIGMLVHNLVDVNANLRYYLQNYYFLWGLCCLNFKDIRETVEGAKLHV